MVDNTASRQFIYALELRDKAPEAYMYLLQQYGLAHTSGVTTNWLVCIQPTAEYASYEQLTESPQYMRLTPGRYAPIMHTTTSLTVQLETTQAVVRMLVDRQMPISLIKDGYRLWSHDGTQSYLQVTRSHAKVIVQQQIVLRFQEAVRVVLFNVLKCIADDDFESLICFESNAAHIELFKQPVVLARQLADGWHAEQLSTNIFVAQRDAQ